MMAQIYFRMTRSSQRLAFATALALTSLTALRPTDASAAAKPGCAQIEGSDLSLDAAVQAGLTKKSAAGWYAAGKTLADEEFANLAYFALDRAIQAGGRISPLSPAVLLDRAGRH